MNSSIEETNLEISKLKKYTKLILIIIAVLFISLIFIYGKEETKIKSGEFGEKLTLEENDNNIQILFETNDYIVTKKVRRYERYFTQGLFMDSKNTLIESSGLYGKSTLQKYFTNSPDDKIFQIPIDKKYFAEGSCLYNEKIFILTWREREVLIYKYEDNKNPKLETTIPLPNEIQEGWGITTDNKDLIISDGTDKIFFVNPDVNEFKVKRSIKVTKPNNLNKTYDNLNELEFAYGYIFANVWMTNNVLVINPENGNIVKIIDFTLLNKFEIKIKSPNENIDVLNGIAYDKYNDGFYLTGKLWTHLYYIKLKFKL